MDELLELVEPADVIGGGGGLVLVVAGATVDVGAGSVVGGGSDIVGSTTGDVGSALAGSVAVIYPPTGPVKVGEAVTYTTEGDSSGAEVGALSPIPSKLFRPEMKSCLLWW